MFLRVTEVTQHQQNRYNSPTGIMCTSTKKASHHPPSSWGNKYILTVINMLTGFTMAVPILNKNSEMICNAYRDHIYCIFGGSSRILMDNGSEFKNKEMQEVCKTLGVKHIFYPVYTPESNRRLEGWHRFFKACIAKHICGEVLNGMNWYHLQWVCTISHHVKSVKNLHSSWCLEEMNSA